MNAEPFEEFVREAVFAVVPTALGTLAKLMVSTETDPDGRPLVPASVKADIAKFLVEQRVGKAKISVDIEAPSVSDFLAQFSGGLTNRDGSAYAPVRGQTPVIEPDDDDLPSGQRSEFTGTDIVVRTAISPDDHPEDWSTPAPAGASRVSRLRR